MFKLKIYMSVIMYIVQNATSLTFSESNSSSKKFKINKKKIVLLEQFVVSSTGISSDFCI